MAQQNHIGTTATTVSTGEDGKTRVTYHNTDVVTFDADEIVLNHGGYMTATTKTRMNQASNQFNLGYRVFQKNFDWFVEVNEGAYELWGKGDQDRIYQLSTGLYHYRTHRIDRRKQREALEIGRELAEEAAARA